MVYLIWWGGIASRSVELLLLLNHHLIIGGHVLLVRITRVLILQEEDVNKNSLALCMKFKTLLMSNEEKHGHQFDLPLFIKFPFFGPWGFKCSVCLS